MDFNSLNIIITGASRGIGKCLANMLSNKGANVIAVYNNTLIDGVNYDTFKCDIGNESDIDNLFKFVINKYKRIDILINGASISQDNDIFDKEKKEFMKVLEVNLVGTFLMCKYASKYMDKGIIINISSTDANDTYNPLSIDYCASKAGIDNMTKNLALRLPNIKVCAIAPNWVNTKTTLSIDPNYLKEEMDRIGQKKLLTEEEVCLKIIDIITNKEIKSGDIIRMNDSNE
jgi:3-oxoacyl-[acyl-carrier protein] reductase